MHNVNSIGWLAADGAPWHGLGNALTGNESRDELLRKCGLDWRYEGKSLYYMMGDEDNESAETVDSHKVTVRSDTGAQLGVVGRKFQYVQPEQVIDTFYGVADANDLQIAVAGALDGGRRLWALARVGDGVELPGRDRIEPFVLLATANDGTMATRASFTAVRVVCHNTWKRSGIERNAEISIRHNQVYDHDSVRDALGITGLWQQQQDAMRAMAERHIDQNETFNFLTMTMGNPELEITHEDQPHKAAMRQVWALMQNGRGAQLTSAANTAWGAFNAVTEYADHHRRARNQDTRLTSAWFGDSAKLKERAYDAAMVLVAA